MIFYATEGEGRRLLALLLFATKESLSVGVIGREGVVDGYISLSS
jgi:hypothetical protein